ncbi:hypothetical protein BVG16_11785 [Paenibacillus selenitireducens]|uniref:YgiT-type zinc finger domain-containing protein n=2 Tax=Paenibacillus selenitireducens TaxID=1324314 RepID=A0A1T2XFF2_9BACL|nr:hypothetical protein BVG16_11785 [Paenibacillus selenitireducens]
MNCVCGHVMNLLLRTVIFAKQTEIRNVPVFTCPNCSRSEVLNYVKKDLTDLIAKYGKNSTEKQSFLFQESNDLVNVLFELFSKGSKYAHIAELEKMLQERINQLLDVFLLAKTMNDVEWMEDVQKRLKLLTGFSVGAYRLNMN